MVKAVESTDERTERLIKDLLDLLHEKVPERRARRVWGIQRIEVYWENGNLVRWVHSDGDERR